MEETVTLEAEGSGERLDVFVTRRCPGLSRSLVQRLIREGRVTAGGRPGRAGQRLERGDRVLVRMPPEEPEALRPEPIPLTIVYEDNDLLVVDKPAGLTVHPAAGVRRGTLAAALLAYRPELADVGGPERPGIVHRLDRDTSGLLVVAKNEAARAALAWQWKERQVEKGYLALVHGRLEPPQGVIDAPIGRDPRHRQRMAVVEGGRAARTAYRVRRYLPDRQPGLPDRPPGGPDRPSGGDVYSLVEVTPSTGRTHQIRVHFAALGHPLVGDRVYGRPSAVLGHQFLHAYRLAFRHPVDGRPLEFESPLPEDLRQALERLAGFAE
jgi:23S rRNA pseudouridine1911/1915/1917 synthase